MNNSYYNTQCESKKYLTSADIQLEMNSCCNELKLSGINVSVIFLLHSSRLNISGTFRIRFPQV